MRGPRRRPQAQHVLNEKSIMHDCKHPFIAELVASFSDGETLYLLMELLLGGDLFSMLRSAKRFQEPVAAFYSGAVVVMFEYLHDRKVVYRDLRPENLMLDSKVTVAVTPTLH